MSESDLVYIDEMVKRSGKSKSTIRRGVKNKTFLQPVKRRSPNESLAWRRTDVDKFFRKESQAPERSTPNNFDLLFNQKIDQRLRELGLI